jgi:hypothetical protein
MIGEDKNLYDYIKDAAVIADIIDNAKQRSQTTKSYANTSKIAFINSIIITCKAFGLKEQQGVDFEGLWYYYKFFKIKNYLDKQPVNNTDVVMEYDDYISKIKAHYGLYSVEHLIANLYRDAPLRNNYSNIKISNEPLPNENCIVIPEDINGTAKLYLTEYKTKSKYGDKIFKLSLYTTRLLKTYINTKKIKDVLFQGDISGIIKKMSDKVGSKGAVNEIRHMISSSLYWKKNTMDRNELTHKILKQIYIMGHQPDTWFGYIRKIK